jgi:hypothetical protein
MTSLALEEHVLRILYEKPASAAQCAAGSESDAIPDTLASLARRGYISIRYAITPSGSEHLAELAQSADPVFSEAAQ